jgi:hypothetical protein
MMRFFYKMLRDLEASATRLTAARPQVINRPAVWSRAEAQGSGLTVT